MARANPLRVTVRSRPLLQLLEDRTVPAPIAPVYSATFADAITGDNEFTVAGRHYWTVDSGADSYQNDFYERPTIQTYQVIDGHYATQEYFGYLDIVQARAGFDDNYLYASIKMFSTDERKIGGERILKGLVERYGIRISTSPDGSNGVLLFVDQPSLKSDPFSFNGNKAFGYRDTDGDVGGTGLTVTKSDNSQEEHGLNGYNVVIISDGRQESTGRAVLFTRVNPNDPTEVEFAIDYRALGLTVADLQTAVLEFEAIKGGAKDPQNYRWNDKYTRSEAGSPNPGSGGRSEFGTQGLGNIYELDTLPGQFEIECHGRISGTKFFDLNADGARNSGEPGLGGWTIYLDSNFNGQLDADERSTVTNSDGGYTFEDLEEGTYQVREILQPGWLLTTAVPTIVLGCNEEVFGVDIGNTKDEGCDGRICGTKFDDFDGDGVRDAGESGLAGWTIYLDSNSNGQLDADERSTITGSDGSFVFEDLAEGTYQVRELVQSGWIQTTSVPTIALACDQQVFGVDIGNFKLIKICGVKFNDCNGNGVQDAGEKALSGWTVYLDSNGNGRKDTGERSQKTDAYGRFCFDNLGPGTYSVREVRRNGWVQITLDPADIEAESGRDYWVSFGNQKKTY